MKNRVSWTTLTLSALMSCSLILFCGCAKKRASENIMDAREHHVFNGMKSLELGKLDEAQSEFNQALAVDPEYGPAHVGMGLISGAKSVEAQDKKTRRTLIAAAFDELKRGKKYARGEDQLVLAYVGYIRVYTATQVQDWLADAEANFKYAVAKDKKAAAPHYYMGEAYKQALAFAEAAEMYRQTLELNRGYTEEANRSWQLLQKIQRAAPGTTVGKRIALVDAVSRAEVAALFMQELRLDKIFEKRSVKFFDTRYKSPKYSLEGESETLEKLPPTADVTEHVLRQDINNVIQVGVRGLGCYPDGTFKPDEKVIRASYAMMLEDILIRTCGNEALATKFIGTASPYPDLKIGLPYFNAALLCTSRGLMAPANGPSGEFRPLDTLSGADAILAIGVLKQELRP